MCPVHWDNYKPRLIMLTIVLSVHHALQCLLGWWAAVPLSGLDITLAMDC